MLDSFLLSALVSIPPALLGFYDYSYTGGAYPEPISRASFVGLTIFSFARRGLLPVVLDRGTAGDTRPAGVRDPARERIRRPAAHDDPAIERWLAMGWWATLLILLPFLALAIASYAVFAVWWVVLVISIIISPTKQGIHDRFSRSALVRPAGQQSMGGRLAWVLAIVTILEIAAVILFASLLNSLWTELYPPGLNPFDYMWEQIRTIWPS